MNYAERYYDAHLLWSKKYRPNVIKDGHYCKPVLKDVTTTNGMTDYCVNMINWLEVGRVKRVNAVVRASDKLVKTESGAVFNDKRYTRSIKKNTSDILGSIRGKMINIEIKNKYTNDKMRLGQWQEKAAAEAVCELYWIVTCVEDFLIQLDGELYGQ